MTEPADHLDESIDFGGIAVIRRGKVPHRGLRPGDENRRIGQASRIDNLRQDSSVSESAMASPPKPDRSIARAPASPPSASEHPVSKPDTRARSAAAPSRLRPPRKMVPGLLSVTGTNMNPLHDLRFALRGWKKSPVTTAVLILALALGIGVNASSFVTVNAIILHPLPYPKLDRIVTVWEAPTGQSADREPVAPANFFDLREQSRSFEALAAYRPWDANLTGAGDPERVAACLATPEFFQVLGLAPALGRTYSAVETESGRHDVVVVSQGFWKRRLAGDPAALGKTVSLDGAAYTIVGVMPEDFNFPLETDCRAPLEFPLAERHDRESHSLAILGRLKPAVPMQQARAEMASIGRRLAAQYPVSNRDRGIQVIPVRELTNNVTDRFVLTLLATAGFVLLLAAANVANLLLVRLANRQREIAVRTAMGATRFGIVRLLVFESAGSGAGFGRYRVVSRGLESRPVR